MKFNTDTLAIEEIVYRDRLSGSQSQETRGATMLSDGKLAVLRGMYNGAYLYNMTHLYVEIIDLATLETAYISEDLAPYGLAINCIDGLSRGEKDSILFSHMYTNSEGNWTCKITKLSSTAKMRWCKSIDKNPICFSYIFQKDKNNYYGLTSRVVDGTSTFAMVTLEAGVEEE